MKNHEKIIYIIKTNFSAHSGIRLLDLKIGETSNIDKRLGNYKTSSAYNVKVLHMWKTSGTSTKSCENGILNLAELYSLKRRDENFVIFEDELDKLAHHIGLLLIPTNKEELAYTGDKKIDMNKKHDCASKKPESFTLFDTTVKVKTWTNVYISFLELVFTKLDTTSIITCETREKTWFSTDGTGFFNPRKIPHTDYYVELNLSSYNIKKRITKIMSLLDIKEQDFSVKLR